MCIVFDTNETGTNFKKWHWTLYSYYTIFMGRGIYTREIVLSQPTSNDSAALLYTILPVIGVLKKNLIIAHLNYNLK